MDVNQYFPDEISEVRWEELRPESKMKEEMPGPSSRRSPYGSYYDLFPSPTPSQAEEQRLLPYVARMEPEEVYVAGPVNEDGRVMYEPLPIPIHCHLCYEKLTLTIVPDYFKPCNCKMVYVHTECGFKDKKYFKSRCARCGAVNSRKQAKKRSFLLSPFVSRAPSAELLEDDSPVNEPVCVECHNQKYVNPQVAERYDACLLQSCFCGTVAHQGCIRELAATRPMCPDCGVKYRILRYGTRRDFFRKNCCEYTIYVMFLLVLAYLVAAPLYSVQILDHDDIHDIRHDPDAFDFHIKVKKTKEELEEFRYPFLISVGALFVTSFLCLSCFISLWTLCRRLPHFYKRYGRITVLPYDPTIPENRRITIRSLRKLQEGPAPEEIPLNTIAVDEHTIDLEPDIPAPVRPNPIRMNQADRTDDLTLGQHMFGVCSSHQSSSTPIAPIEGGFVFQKIDEE